jgi:DNA repair protein RadC
MAGDPRTSQPGNGQGTDASPDLVSSLSAERPRERLAIHGPAALSAAELIGVLWSTGTRGHTALDAAADALARHAGLVGLARASDLELEAVSGVGPVRAAQLVAAFELGRRVVTDWPPDRWIVKAPRDVGQRLVPLMGFLERE